MKPGIPLTEVETAILNICENIVLKADEKGWPNGLWGPETILEICRYGDRLGYDTCSTAGRRAGLGSGEYLWDAAWFKKNGQLALTLECEWGRREDIFFDFRKLAYSVTELRCMIFQGRGSEIESTFEDLEVEAKRLSVPQYPMRYLLLGFDHPEPVRKFRERVIEV